MLEPTPGRTGAFVSLATGATGNPVDVPRSRMRRTAAPPFRVPAAPATVSASAGIAAGLRRPTPTQRALQFAAASPRQTTLLGFATQLPGPQ